MILITPSEQAVAWLEQLAIEGLEALHLSVLSYSSVLEYELGPNK